MESRASTVDVEDGAILNKSDTVYWRGLLSYLNHIVFMADSSGLGHLICTQPSQLRTKPTHQMQTMVYLLKSLLQWLPCKLLCSLLWFKLVAWTTEYSFHGYRQAEEAVHEVSFWYWKLIATQLAAGHFLLQPQYTDNPQKICEGVTTNALQSCSKELFCS